MNRMRLFRISINLNSKIYFWGKGYVCSQQTKEDFHNECYKLIKEMGFHIKLAGNSTPPEGLLNKENVYLHPLEFTGFLSDENMDKFEKLVREQNSPYHKVCSVTVREVISDNKNDREWMLRSLKQTRKIINKERMSVV